MKKLYLIKYEKDGKILENMYQAISKQKAIKKFYIHNSRFALILEVNKLKK